MTRNWQEASRSAYDYQLALNPRINDLCAPLRKIGVNGYYYFKLRSDGTYLLFTDNEHVSKWHHQNVRDEGEFYTQEIEKTGTQVRRILVSGEISHFDEKTDPILHRIWDFDFWNILTTYHVNKEGHFEGHGFSLGRYFERPAEFFLENLSLLDQFSTYFLDRVGGLVNFDDERKVGQFEQKFQFSRLSEDQLLALRVLNFLRETSKSRFSIQQKSMGIRFTKREKQCLDYLAQHMTIKEIARNLDLSPRTVESHIANARHKAGSSSKTKLMEIFTQNKYQL